MQCADDNENLWIENKKIISVIKIGYTFWGFHL